MVAPVRCATPGTEVAWARYPPCWARSTIQSASTPPPSPPSATTGTVVGRPVPTSGCPRAALAGPFLSSSRSEADVHAPLQPADHRAAYLALQPIPSRRVGDDRSAVERRAKHGRVRNLAAQSAADAGIDHLRHRLAPQRIGIGRERERWAPR